MAVKDVLDLRFRRWPCCGPTSLFLANPDYAWKFDFTPENMGNDMKSLGYLAVSTLFDPARADGTGFFLADWFFGACLYSYLSVVDIERDPAAYQDSIYAHDNKDFPLTLSSDGNFGSFGSQAVEFKAELLDGPGATFPHLFELDIDDPFADQIHAAQLLWRGILG